MPDKGSSPVQRDQTFCSLYIFQLFIDRQSKIPAD